MIESRSHKITDMQRNKKNQKTKSLWFFIYELLLSERGMLLVIIVYKHALPSYTTAVSAVVFRMSLFSLTVEIELVYIAKS